MQGKLVRDQIPAIILKNEGTKPRVRRLSSKEFKLELLKKLLEEATEVTQAKNKKEIAAEIADVYEVLDAIMGLHALTRVEILTLQKQKKKARGGFTQRLYLIQ